VPGKKLVIFKLRKVFDKKSIKLKAIKGIPILNEVFKFSLLVLKIASYYFSFIAIFLLYVFINTEIVKLKNK